MVTPEVESLVADIAKDAENYAPCPETAACIEDKVLVPIIGPLAVGKTTVMREVTHLDNDFGQEVGFTTREPRHDEPLEAYRFLPHDVKTLRAIKDEVRARQLVQVAVHPTTKRIYGSAVQDYNSPFNVIDIMATAMDQINDLPFKEIVTVSLTAPVADWHKRLAAREQTSSLSENKKRRIEAVASLEWSLDQGEQTAWVINNEGQAKLAALEVIGLARGQLKPNPSNRRHGEMMLKAAQELI